MSQLGIMAARASVPAVAEFPSLGRDGMFGATIESKCRASGQPRWWKAG